MKILGSCILTVVLAALHLNAECATTTSADWRLLAFDEANAAYMENARKECAFLVGQEPSLQNYEYNLYLPWLKAMECLRRLIFIEKMRYAPETLQMEGNPWGWALETPSSDEDIRTWLRRDEGGKIRNAYDNMRRTLTALQAESKMLAIRNRVCAEHRRELSLFGEELARELRLISESVNGKLKNGGEKTETGGVGSEH